MEKLSIAELIERCEKYQRKLQRYEGRFSALVDAYKNLTEEKNVLESTLQALSPKKSAESPSDDGSDTGGVESEGDEKSLEEKINTLSSALQAMTEAKINMEATFLADKRSTIAEYTKQLSDAKLESNKANESVNELKAKLRSEQKERENDQCENNVMLKELQMLVNAERLEKDELRLQLKEKDDILKKGTESNSKVYEEKIAGLKKELSATQEKIRSQEVIESQAKLENLTREMEEIKRERLQDLTDERERTHKAEDMLKSRQDFEENRIAELEERLSELSSAMGRYDLLRQQDQQMIRSLKERLEAEDCSQYADQNKVSELEEQVVKLKELLKLTVRRTEHKDLSRLSSFDLDEMLTDDSIHHTCQLDYKYLRQEFEAYKIKSMLDGGASKPGAKKVGASSGEMLQYKKRVEKLENALKKQELVFAEEEREHLRIISNLQVSVTSIEDECSKRIESLQQEHLKTVSQLENEMTKQRERTLDLLMEKDTEIDQLRALHYEDEYLLKKQTPSSSGGLKSDQEITAVAADVHQEIDIAPLSPSKCGTMVHYTEKIEEQTKELSLQRNQILDLQTELRDCERKEYKIIEQMNILKEEIRKMERDRSRESANLEYLKNMCIKYMTCGDVIKKRQISTTIATILSFSPQEISMIESKQKNGWW